MNLPKAAFYTIVILVLVAALIAALSLNDLLSAHVENARVQCIVEGEVVFDQIFDRAQLQPSGFITVWRGDEAVVVDGADCHIVD